MAKIKFEIKKDTIIVPHLGGELTFSCSMKGPGIYEEVK